MSPEALPEPELTLNRFQVAALRKICGRYNVEFAAEHYMIFPPDSTFMASWCQGWVGGPEHATGSERPTIYIGVSPAGDIHS